MKNFNIITLLSLSLLSTIAYSQQDCNIHSATYSMYNGSIKKEILHTQNGVNCYHYKTESGASGNTTDHQYAPLITSENFWVGGYYRDGTYNFSGGTKDQFTWRPGQIDFNGMPSDCEDYDKIYVVTKADLRKAAEVFESGGPCQDIPLNVLNWPGHGNPYNNLNLDYHLADFYDHDQDNVYNPCSGDLPIVPYTPYVYQSNSVDLVKHFPCEVSLHFMRNSTDQIIPNTLPSVINAIVYNYRFERPGLKNMIFETTKFIHNNSEDLIDAKVAQYTQFQLGCNGNDKVGYHPITNTIYAYNDGLESCTDNPISNPNIMIATTPLFDPWAPYVFVTDGDSTILENPQAGTGYVDTLVSNPMSVVSILDNCESTSSSCLPSTLEEYEYLMQALRIDGTSFINIEGMPNSQPYDGNPAINGDYTMCGGDKINSIYSIQSSIPFVLQPGAHNIITKANYVLTYDDEGCPDNSLLAYKAQSLKENFNHNLFLMNGPDAPKLSIEQNEDEGLKIQFEKVPVDYAEQVDAHSNNVYQFEGILLYQVASEDFDMNEINNPQVSKLIYQGDIQNNIGDVGQWEERLDNGNIVFDYNIAVSGSNAGIADEFIFDYDYLNDRPFESDETYFFVAKSYAVNASFLLPPNADIEKYTYLPTLCCHEISRSDITSNVADPSVFNSSIVQKSNNLEIMTSFTDNQLYLYDIMGRPIYHRSLDRGLTQIDLNGVLSTSGVYLASVQGRSGVEMMYKKLLFVKE